MFPLTVKQVSFFLSFTTKLTSGDGVVVGGWVVGGIMLVVGTWLEDALGAMEVDELIELACAVDTWTDAVDDTIIVLMCILDLITEWLGLTDTWLVDDLTVDVDAAIDDLTADVDAATDDLTVDVDAATDDLTVDVDAAADDLTVDEDTAIDGSTDADEDDFTVLNTGIFAVWVGCTGTVELSAARAPDTAIRTKTKNFILN